jgi:hypothetical protein
MLGRFSGVCLPDLSPELVLPLILTQVRHIESSADDPIAAHLRPQALARYPKQLRRF